ncbi:MAG: hypothetical protein WC741_02705 [Patescibacteria group bacterium]|jgi:hypothetical protein
MNSSSKILKIIFFVLLAVAVGEVFYLFSGKPNNKLKPSGLTPTPCLNCQNVASDKLAFDPTAIQYLGTITKDDWSYTLLQEITGSVVNFKISGDQITFDLIDDKNVLIEKFNSSVTKSKFPRKIFFQKGEDKTLADDQALLALKNGDKIKVTRYYDLSQFVKDGFKFNELIIFK